MKVTKSNPIFALITRLQDSLQLAGNAEARLFGVLKNELLVSARAILCTVATASKVLLSDELAPAVTRIKTAILDEAGTCPESKLPLLCSLPQMTRIIAIGDHKQLAPFSHIRGGQNGVPDEIKGYFQRIEAALDGNIAMLQEQYRMHPNICEFISSQFYNNTLETPREIEITRQASDKDGLYWLSYPGDNAEHSPLHSTSKVNPEEVRIILNLLACPSNRSKSVMVITFYKAQEKMIREEALKAGIRD